MVTKKTIKDFDNLDNYPDLKKSLVPSVKTLPLGSINIKVIINKGEIIERVYKSPQGEFISLFPKRIFSEAA